MKLSDLHTWPICLNCLQMIVDGDDSGMSEKDAIDCRNGLASVAEDFVLVATDNEPSFSRDMCFCCSALAGDRVDVLLVPTREDQLG